MQFFSRPTAVSGYSATDLLAPGRSRLGWPDLWIAMAGLALLMLWDGTSLDLLMIRAWGSPTGFAWQEHWLTRDVLHQGGRLLAWGVAAVLLVNIVRPLWPEQTRRERIWWLAATLCCVILIPLLKRGSLTSCPWDLAEFGGVAHYVSHWRIGISDGGSGRCFPSGHASSAFSFLSGYFALRRAYPNAARRWLYGVIAVGALFGWAQMARGAHYASHTMWTAWLCWLTCTLGARWILPRR